MKKLVVIFLIIIGLQSCLVQQKAPTRNYLTIKEIKNEYRLTRKECKSIIYAAENDELECKYNPILECWTYDDRINYNVFRMAK